MLPRPPANTLSSIHLNSCTPACCTCAAKNNRHRLTLIHMPRVNNADSLVCPYCLCYALFPCLFLRLRLTTAACTRSHLCPPRLMAPRHNRRPPNPLCCTPRNVSCEATAGTSSPALPGGGGHTGYEPGQDGPPRKRKVPMPFAHAARISNMPPLF